MSNLGVNYRYISKELDKLADILVHISPLPPKYRKFIAEITLLRAFSVCEDTLLLVACKLVCGAPYCDGSKATLLSRARSADDAEDKMRNFGRGKARWNLCWTRATEIKENLRYLVDSKDHFMTVIDQNGTFVDEFRRVRNRIAHNNPNSRKAFSVVVRRYYGAHLNNISPGTLLLSDRRSPVLIDQYLTKCRLLMKHLLKA